MRLQEILEVIAGLESERLTLPVNRFSLAELFSKERAEIWNGVLAEYQKLSFTKEQLIHSLREIQNQKMKEVQGSAPDLELVWTGPETPNSTLRDTAIVVQELFREAKEEVLIVGFAFYQGKTLFKELAEKFDKNEGFKTKFFVDVRRDGDTSEEAAVLLKFKVKFKNNQWPGEELPEIYYDPRTLQLEDGVKSSMHAKCIIVDGRKAFITSANFTQAAHYRNIEAGVVIDSKEFAMSLRAQFLNLVEGGIFKKI